jgi:hypothetical protein
LDGMLHGSRAGNAAADLVRQAAEVVLQRRRLQRGLNHSVRIVVGGLRGCGETGEKQNANKEQGLYSSHIRVQLEMKFWKSAKHSPPRARRSAKETRVFLRVLSDD